MDILDRIIAKKLYGGSGGGSGGGEKEEWIGDGNTHIWISLPGGRTSPRLGIGANGTVTVDWGDGSEPDTLTGQHLESVIRTPAHEYANPGDYVITLYSNDQIGVVGGQSSTGDRSYLLSDGGSSGANQAYLNSIQKVELGSNVTSIGSRAFQNCYSLTSVNIPDGVTSIGDYAFSYCYSLTSVNIPDGVTSIGTYAFQNCYALANVRIPDGVTSIGDYAFQNCRSLASVRIPDGVTSIENRAFQNCYSLTNLHIPDSVTSIGTYAFSYCECVAYYDFTNYTAVPTLSNTNAFAGIASDCEIRVPAALVDEWKAATNWSTYADKIVGV